MVEKKTKTSRPLRDQSTGSLRNKNNLKFFVERSSETVERTLQIVQKLQNEINQLKEGLLKADNQFPSLNQLARENKKKDKNQKN